MRDHPSTYVVEVRALAADVVAGVGVHGEDGLIEAVVSRHSGRDADELQRIGAVHGHILVVAVVAEVLLAKAQIE